MTDELPQPPSKPKQPSTQSPATSKAPKPKVADDNEGYSIKGFMLTAVLVLPLAFFIWFYLSGLLVMPTAWMLEGILRLLVSYEIYDISRNAYQLNAELLVSPPPGMQGRGQAVAAVPLNPLIYGYGLALTGGLVFCVPLSNLRRLLQLGVLFALVSLVQTWGCFWELLKDLSFRQVLGADGLAIVEQVGVSQELVGFAYQFGYLVLPSIVPIVSWIILNRRFVESLVQPGVFGPSKP